MTNNQLVIIRGLPGSGKSTLARTIAKEYGHVFIETDMFFETPTGYVFDRTRLPDAIAWATSQVRSLILQGPVVTTGVFTKVSSWAHLADLSTNILVIECVGQHGSVHNVPRRVMESMRARWEPFPGAVIHN